jgi:5-methyltetrahydrofolate--homocysteine methyltransferase
MRIARPPTELTRNETFAVVDGAIGTELIGRGADASRLELENLTHPARVLEVARAYVQAGAQLLRTNSFQANRVALEARGVREDVTTLNRRAAELALEAARGNARVVGSIGPIGIRRRSPHVEVERARAAYAEQAEALVSGGAALLLLETFVDLDEAELALEAVSNSGVLCGVSMSFDAASGEPQSLGGATPSDLCAVAERHGAPWVGANCGRGLWRIEAVIEAFSKSRLPVWLAPSAGVPGTIPIATADDFARLAARLRGTNVAFFGGCCGTDPSFVRAIAECSNTS